MMNDQILYSYKSKKAEEEFFAIKSLIEYMEFTEPSEHRFHDSIKRLKKKLRYFGINLIINLSGEGMEDYKNFFNENEVEFNKEVPRRFPLYRWFYKREQRRNYWLEKIKEIKVPIHVAEVESFLDYV